MAFADKLREALYVLNPTVKSQRFGDYRHRSLASVIDEFGWEHWKESDYSDDIRGLLQRMGTEVGRNMLGQDTWVNAALNDLSDDAKVVITDVRFQNEVEAIDARGGEVWRIERAGNGPANDHISETGLDDYPFYTVIHNDSTVESFKDAVSAVWEEDER